MSEQKKPKIDLKARLGKKSVGTPQGAGGAIPPPVGIPKPPAMMPGMPGMRGDAGPRIDASDPYAAIEARHAAKAAEPKAIKIEMSEEVVEGQKKLMKRAILIGVVISLFMWVIGFAFGDRSRNAKTADAALIGAAALVKEVEAANVEANKLAEVLDGAAEKLSKGEFPADQVTKLGEINIPFEGTNLTDKGIGRFRPELVNALVTYTNLASGANEQKEKLQGILGGARAGIEDLLKQRTAPKVHWGVFIQNGPKGPWANMQMLPAPFLASADWPAEFKIKEGNQEHTLKRFESGDPVKAESPQMVPVAPQTETSVCPESTVVRLRMELLDMQKILKGDQTPGREKQGFTELGDSIAAQLRKIGTPG